VIGTVASKTASAITVTSLAGQTITVNVSPATTYSVRGVSTATLDNITVGERIVAQGTPNADGSIDATLIQVGTGGRGFGTGRGRGGGTGLPTPAPSAGASGPST
jgi:ABC-type Fe3+-hydroxamate transport system substrate-binding protein